MKQSFLTMMFAAFGGISVASAQVQVECDLTSAGCSDQPALQAALDPATRDALVLNLEPAPVAKKFRLGISVYAGWMPWYLAAEKLKILEKWALRYNIDLVLITDDAAYAASLAKLQTGDLDAVVVTNMDALLMFAKEGHDVTAVVVGDTSHGNDGVVAKGWGKALAANPQLKPVDFLRERKGSGFVMIPGTVSEYVFHSMIEEFGLSASDYPVEAMADENSLQGRFRTDAKTLFGVTWKPWLDNCLETPGSGLIYTSAQVQYQIQDFVAVKTTTLRRNPEFGEFLAGAWVETIGFIKDPANRAEQMKWMAGRADLKDSSAAAMEAQFQTTNMFWTAQEIYDFMVGSDIRSANKVMLDRLYSSGMMGMTPDDARSMGIEFWDKDGKKIVIGNARNIKLRFDPSYVDKAIKGQLLTK